MATNGSRQQYLCSYTGGLTLRIWQNASAQQRYEKEWKTAGHFFAQRRGELRRLVAVSSTACCALVFFKVVRVYFLQFVNPSCGYSN